MVTEKLKMAMDGLSLAAVVATLAAWLPPLAALASLVWTLIRIYETETFQGWLQKLRTKRQQRKDLEESDYSDEQGGA